MNMPWFRFYSEFMDDPKIAMMSDSDQLVWVKALCLASEGKNRGTIEMSDNEICWKLRISVESWQHAIDKFRAKGMIEHTSTGYQIINWHKRQFSSDNSTPRSQKSRAKQKAEQQIEDATLQQQPCNVAATPPDTDTDYRLQIQITDSDSETENIQEGNKEKYIKPTDADFEIFREAWNKDKPDHWATCQELGKKRLTALKNFVTEHGDRSMEIFQDGLAYARQDKWCMQPETKLGIDNYLTNNKPVQWAEKFANCDRHNSESAEEAKAERTRRTIENLQSLGLNH